MMPRGGWAILSGNISTLVTMAIITLYGSARNSSRTDGVARCLTTGVDTPPISPINMASQERIKLERKRARNRQAATRCRNRKLERIATLQDQADRLRATNNQLASEVGRLRETVYQLRRDISRHSAAGCHPMIATSMSVAFPSCSNSNRRLN